MHRRSCLPVLLCLVLFGCDDNPTTPPTPTPTPAPAPAPAPAPSPPPPPAPTTAALTGLTKNSDGLLIGFVKITVADGPDMGRTATSDGFTGAYRFESLTIGNANFIATATNFLEDRRGVFVNGTNTLDFTLAPGPPPGPALEITGQQLNSGGGVSEWGFQATGSGSFKSYNWDFGDGGAASNSRAFESHLYTAAGVYLVRCNAVPTSGGPNVTATLTITVSI